MNRALLSAVVAAAGLLPQAVQIGDVPQYTFDRPLLNGMGTTSLADLRGKPVFIEFWGHKAAAVDDTMREVLAWQEAWGDDLTVLFSEVKKASDLKAASFALHKEWLGGRAMWTTETPCRVGLKGALPQFVLLSSDGVVLLKGTTESFELGYRDELVAQIEQHIRTEVERRRRGPADLSPRLAPAWEAFAEGRIAEAFDVAHAVADDPEGGAALEQAARSTLATFRERVERRLRRVEWQIESGYLPHAEEELERLSAGSTGALEREPDLAARHAQLVATLADDGLGAEWKAARELAKLESKLYANGPKSVIVRQLERFVRKHADTKCAEHAAFLVEAAETSPFK